MSRSRDLRELQRCLDREQRPAPELMRRLDADPRLRRRARALRRIDQGLREELDERALPPAPPIAGRVLAALEPRRADAGRRLALRLALPLGAAAAALLAVWLLRPSTVAPEMPAPGVASTAPLQPVPWAPLLWSEGLVAPAPERALREEGRRLADDTRRVASSLWSHLSIASWLTREDAHPR